MPDGSIEPLRALLEETGYHLGFRTGPWVECIATWQQEAWIGRGVCEATALEDVLRRMLPCSLAWDLVQQLLPSAKPEDAPPVLADAPPPVAEAAPTPPEPVQELPSPEPVVEEAPPVEAVAAPVPEPAVEEAPPAEAVAAPVPEPATPAELEEAPRVEAAVAALEITTPPVEEAPLVEGASLPEQAGEVDVAASEETAERAAPTSSPGVVAAGASYRGVGIKKSREGFLALPEHGLFAVAGGLAGHPAADVAARVALDALRDSFEATQARARQQILPRLVAAIEHANERVHAAAAADAKLGGMTATLAAVRILGRRVALAHLGDARVYRLRGGILELLTTDHSTANEALRKGKRAARPTWGGLTRVLGGAASVEIDATAVTPRPGDVLLLCTGGLHRAISHEELAEILASDPAKAADRAIARARRAGVAEAATALVLHLPA